MSLTVAQLGARMHYAVPRILNSQGRLDRLFTDICATKGWPRLLKLAPPRLLSPGVRRLRERVPFGVPADKITAFNAFGMDYARRLRRAGDVSQMVEVFLWAGTRFNELIISAGLGDTRAIYGFNCACEVLFQEARRSGIKTLLEQTIAPRVVELQLLNKALEDWPQWGPRLVDDHVQEFDAREHSEWQLADVILCGSEFVRDGVKSAGGDAAKCVVVPYGVERGVYQANAADHPTSGRELVVLFVGGVSLRKGIPYLFEAMRRLSALSVRCRVVGASSYPKEFLASVAPPNVELIGAIPRSRVSQEYSRAHVFCLPSLCEGSATVTYEALAAGLPVITTPNSGSIVRDGLDGLIIPSHDASALAGALTRLLDDRALLRQMGKVARERSAYGSLSAYAQRLLDVVDRL